jgi:hypothetical protein
VQAIIITAGQTMDGALLVAAGAVQEDIDAAVTTLGDQLTKNINQVDAAAKSDLDRLQALTKELGTEARATLDQATKDAAALLVQIGIGANAPIVRSYSPRFTTAAVAANGLNLHLAGVFPRAYEPGYTPTLTVNGVAQPSAALTANDLTDLTFRLPPHTFASGVAGISPPQIEVDIPYAKGHVFKSVVPGRFHIQIATLPDNPASKVTLTTTMPVPPIMVPHPILTQDVYLNRRLV